MTTGNNYVGKRYHVPHKKYKLYYRKSNGSKTAVLEGALRVILDENGKPEAVVGTNTMGEYFVQFLAQDIIG